METLTRRDLDSLLATENSHCVSLYMPTHRTGREIREDGTRFSNLIRRSADALRAKGVNGLKLQAVVDSLEELKHDGVFWQNQSDGLAIFFDGGDRKLYRLPLRFKETVVVGPRFHVRPLLPLFEGDGRFYILVVSQNAVRLFEGSRFAVNELKDDRLPKNLREALNIDEYQQSLQFQSMRGADIGTGTRGNAAFHGHGGGTMDVKKSDELLPYFRRIDRALQELFGVEEAPLVFAGVEYLFPLFKEASQYNNLVDEPITGNFDIAPPEDLHAQAWPLVESQFYRLRDAELERLYTPKDPRPHSSDLAEILSGARVGRVETLFLSNGGELPGRYEIDETTGECRISDPDEAGGEDLLNAAAVESMRTGAKVFTVPAERLPHRNLVAARFRWAVEPAPAR
jgi:Bacterial archaeo-eukaryotic release factor family 7